MTLRLSTISSNSNSLIVRDSRKICRTFRIVRVMTRRSSLREISLANNKKVSMKVIRGVFGHRYLFETSSQETKHKETC